MTKRKKMMIWILAAVLVVALLIVACDSRLLLRSYVIETEEVSDPVRLVVLTDLHSCRYGNISGNCWTWWRSSRRSPMRCCWWGIL